MLRMLDLFAGIGGFSYAGEKLVGGYETVAFCEYDDHAQKVLRKHWPETEIITDIRDLANDADRFRGLVDIITGGYPCQPFSQAGKRLGDQDDRHLWPEMLRVIEAVRPRWVIGENVAGHITMGLDTVLSDLEGAGYACRCFVIPAVAADARHRRDRCWIVAHSDSEGEPTSAVDEKWMGAEIMGDASSCRVSGNDGRESIRKLAERCEDVADTDGAHPQGGRVPSGIHPQHTDPDIRSDQSGRFASQFGQPEPELGRVAYGIPGRVHRLKQLGNSIVPQVAARILHAIKEVEHARN